MLPIPIVVIILASLYAAQTDPVKYIGVIEKANQAICQGVFFTRKFLGTSCRCIGTTVQTGYFEYGEPEWYKVKSWSPDPIETRSAIKLHFYEMCGIEPNKVLLDLGLVEVDQPFSSESVEEVPVPNAGQFRFYNYIGKLIKFKKKCNTSTLEYEQGTTSEVVVFDSMSCLRGRTCTGGRTSMCILPTISTNHICAGEDCMMTAGAPLICHGMLVGIHAGLPVSELPCQMNPISSQLYLRLDYVADWIGEVVCTTKKNWFLK